MRRACRRYGRSWPMTTCTAATAILPPPVVTTCHISSPPPPSELTGEACPFTRACCHAFPHCLRRCMHHYPSAHTTLPATNAAIRTYRSTALRRFCMYFFPLSLVPRFYLFCHVGWDWRAADATGIRTTTLNDTYTARHTLLRATLPAFLLRIQFSLCIARDIPDVIC